MTNDSKETCVNNYYLKKKMIGKADYYIVA